MMVLTEQLAPSPAEDDRGGWSRRDGGGHGRTPSSGPACGGAGPLARPGAAAYHL